jgi:ABC-type transport system substrate-binding protein
VARRRLIAAALVVAAIAATGATGACTRSGRSDDGASPAATAPSTTGSHPADDADEPAVEDPIGAHAEGGSVRVAVWGAPEPGAPTLGGAAVRSLVLPQLFFAKPDGRWGPLIVEPGTDRAADDRRSASFRLRRGAAWSDGSPITADDLRRSRDERFVEAVEGPADDGTITLRFTQPLPGWRRLWSATDAITPPRDGVWGGPFAVASTTAGLETVLRPNPGWRGQGPLLDEVRLVLVPETTMARQLLQRGDVDVIAPLAEPRRTRLLQDSDGISIHSTAADGGWWFGLRVNAERVAPDVRRAITSTIDRDRFVSVLLADEATRLDGFGGPQDTTWSGAGWRGPDTDAVIAPIDGDTIDLVGRIEEPMTGLLHRAMQKRARAAGGRFELRAAESDRVEPWLAERSFDAVLTVEYDAPSICWRCRWESVDAALATAADSGDLNAVGALEAKLAADDLVVPIWRPRATVAWRTGVVAPLRANPYGLSAAWDVWRWHRP